MKTFAQFIEEIHQTAKEHGWWDEPVNEYEKITLMHSELSEAVEELRAGKPALYSENSSKPEGWLVELIDCTIRIFDFIGKKGYAEEFELVLQHKMDYNKTRPYRHGNKLA